MRAATVLSVLCFASAAWAKPIPPPRPNVIPADGAVVGRNTKLWVFGLVSFIELYKDSLPYDVGLTRTTITIPPALTLTKFTPMAPLAPGEYEVGGEVSSKFTVTDDDDTAPPPQPEFTVAANGKVGSAASRVTVFAAESADSFLAVMGEPQVWEPRSLYAAGPTGFATVVDLSAGKHTLKVVQVDAAGNASEPLELTVDVPKDRACSVAPVLPLSFLAIALLRARRARRESIR